MPRVNREQQSPRCLTENYYTAELLQCRLSPRADREASRYRMYPSLCAGENTIIRIAGAVRKLIAGTCRIYSRVSFGIKVHQTTPRRRSSSARISGKRKLSLSNYVVECFLRLESGRLIRGCGSLQRRDQDTGRD